MATNRHDTLDPALLRPGRLDRKIEFPLPDRRQKRLIFSTITAKMNLSEEVDLEDCILCSRIKYRKLLSCKIGLIVWQIILRCIKVKFSFCLLVTIFFKSLGCIL